MLHRSRKLILSYFWIFFVVSESHPWLADSLLVLTYYFVFSVAAAAIETKRGRTGGEEEEEEEKKEPGKVLSLLLYSTECL